MLKKASIYYNQIFCKDNIQTIERVVVAIAALALIIHLALITIARNFETIGLVEGVGTSYISAVFTPFGFLLLFEVFLLILTIPDIMVKSIARQYEIITIIVIWRVFKDASELDSFDNIVSDGSDLLIQILADMAVGLVLFVLLTMFYYSLKSSKVNETDLLSKADYNKFKAIKKIITFILVLVLTLFAGFYIAEWVHSIVVGDPVNVFDFQTEFFLSLFTVMIFTDILLVLLTYAFMGNFSIVFRNASFIVSTVFIRLSLTVERPYDLVLAVVALAFGLGVNLVYNSYVKIVEQLPGDKDFQG